jgi:hypothetical protein
VTQTGRISEIPDSDLPKAISISVLYHAAEDRLACVATAADNSQLALMVTRRLTTRLVNGFAHLLERTSLAAQEAPERARGDIVMFEHQGAIASGAQAAPAAESLPSQGISKGTETTRLPSMLMDAIDIKIRPKLFILSLKSGGKAVAQMQVTRADLHRLLALLRRKCDEADWDIKNETSWLDLDAGSMTLN